MSTENQVGALFAKNLSVGYGASPLFKEINLELQAGRLTCFMGPNGIGKSTLIRTLAGLQKSLSGDFSKMDETKIALVLTDKVLSNTMRVIDLVSYGRYPYLNWGVTLSPQDRIIVEQSIADVNIQGLTFKKLEELSDGQMQLAMIARALAQETPILLLDEPTAHLDLNNRVEIMKLLHRLAREKNKAILVATHELDLALQLADQIWLATPDKKLKIGIPEDLVLDGSFDDIFQFKGFDLKTGKIQHASFRKPTINLVGSGYEFLWTKNALEREGFSVSPDGKVFIKIENEGKSLRWIFGNESFHNIGQMMNRLRLT